MVMIIVIDGYNVLKQQHPELFIDDNMQRSFLYTIARYGKQKKHKMVVVFDGGHSSWPHKKKVAGVTVLFSGLKQAADEIIKLYLEDHKNKDLLLVSSDHELILFAAEQDIVSIGAAEFTYLVQQAMQEKTDSIDSSEIAFDELETDFDTIMQQATQQIPIKEEDTQKKERRLACTHSSKKDRKLIKKLKKL
jgi:predicted RNA-binding protein with PIN domain